MTTAQINCFAKACQSTRDDWMMDTFSVPYTTTQFNQSVEVSFIKHVVK